eukprot:CAMPEP_0179952128 /NCGR_PEP_ID=MMETSP0983-20121128/24074_1 /TAXON_ID=483367 /ORGANISM="non described non described, Strain CCMP 2436" /LENGTH=65 /DNA_ID=CAMNT_0021862655 /DNA_START=47 /DNA_END=241 /DNA_ORIENTATION=+
MCATAARSLSLQCTLTSTVAIAIFLATAWSKRKASPICDPSSSAAASESASSASEFSPMEDTEAV